MPIHIFARIEGAMPGRWVLNPVVLLDITDAETGQVIEQTRIAKAGALIEPGRGKRYQHVSIIDAPNYALTFVKAVDFSALDADSQIINLFEGNVNALRDWLDETPNTLGWNAARMTRIRNRLAARGIDTTELTMNSTIEQILDRVAGVIGGSWGRVRKLHI
jgi:hypothetical protein